VSETPAPTPSRVAPGPIPATPLRGRTLVLARGTWLAVAVLALGFFAAGIPSEFVMFRTVCQDVCMGGQLHLAGSHALRVSASPWVFTPPTRWRLISSSRLCTLR
jgi:hypothetical protein